MLVVCLSLPNYSNAATDLLKAGKWDLVQPNANELILQSTANNGLKLTINKAVDPFYELQASRMLLPAVPEGNLVRLKFRARSATNNPIRVMIEQAVDPWAAVIQALPKLTPQWQSFEMTGDSPGFGVGGLGLRVQIGQQIGVVELADISVEDLGPDPEIISARAAVQPQSVAARIQKFRTGMMKIVVTDSNGKPAQNVSVNVTEERSDFLFGANIIPLNLRDSSDLQLKYRKRFTDLLNYATLPVYWGDFERRQGVKDTQRLRETALWCIAHGIENKGHPLIWQESYPTWAPHDADAAIPLMRDRVHELVGNFQDCIHRWDVVNEANAAGMFPTTGIGNWVLRDGPAVEVETALGWAREAAKNREETFIDNDYDFTDSNLKLLAKLQADGKLPDAIGIQSHMHSGNWPLEKVWRIAEQFSKFGRPIHFTETTVLSGEHRPIPKDANVRATDWPSTSAGEAEQADYLAKFYSLLFSNPNVAAITYWDLGDHDSWLGAPAGLVRADMSPKPAYDRLMQLIHHDWWTNADLKTVADGKCETRAFFGDYSITVTDAAGRKNVRKVSYSAKNADEGIVVQAK
jgi:GH35 family endo-1,4-beta-xylanase